MIGRTISHYRIVAPLGSGGMGVVYRAEDVRLGREVAVKFVSEDLADDEQAVQRLRSEARAASALNHSNICTIYDVGEVDGHPFIVMELLKGLTLRERLQSGPVKVSQLLDIGIEVADALHTAHTNGIIHRDIKPGNILITERGHVKILDFGLAKLTAAFSGASTTGGNLAPTIVGTALGTISYMSPEQATGEELDGRTDIFSLGVVLYECATGAHPFPGKTSAVTFEAILNKAPIAPISLNPDLPLRLQEVINNCLEKDRELRYQSAADLRADLKRVRRDIESSHSRTVQVATADRVRSGQPTLSGRIDPAASEPVTAKLPPDASVVRISRMQLAAGIGVLLLVVGFGVYALWNRSPAVSQESTRTIPAAAATIEEPLRLAVASLAARNYRAAANYADQVLAIDPGNSEAKRIQAESRVIMARFDAAIDDAREHLSAGDTQGAAAALDRAREIDPGSPVV
ncbi:MAG TPA: serine/threonine-protein kinase, partial [Vicinamibacterales bacterium]|nr:serine/threonine-protein kinase [Vicinamibacterales bacterium]